MRVRCTVSDRSGHGGMRNAVGGMACFCTDLVQHANVADITVVNKIHHRGTSKKRNLMRPRWDAAVEHNTRETD